MANKKSRTTTKKVQALENLPAPKIPDVDVKPEVDDDPLELDGLTIRQKRFVLAMVGPATGNATRAAALAGYNQANRKAMHVTAFVTLSNPRVQAALARAFAQQNYSPEWAKAGLMDLASSSLANFLTVNADGVTEIDFVKAAEAGALGQIKEYHEEAIKMDGSPASVLKRTIRLHDRRAALETLLKIDGKIINRVQLVPYDLSQLSDQQLSDIHAILTCATTSNRIAPFVDGN